MSSYPSPTDNLEHLSSVQFEPTAEQLARELAIRRFRRLYVYLPIGIAVALAAIILIIVLIGLFAPGLVGANQFISALADIIVILWIIPMLVITAVPTIGYIAYVINRRQRRQRAAAQGVNVDRSRVQLLLWRVQQLMDRVHAKGDEWAPIIAAPVIAFNTLLAEAEAWLTIVKRQFTPSHRSRKNDRDGTRRS